MTNKLPVKLAKDVLEKYGLQQVIVLCKDKDGVDHFITYGDTPTTCMEAGVSADRMKRAFGWPEGSLTAYTTKCLIPNCTVKMPHWHDNKTGKPMSKGGKA